MDRRSRPLSLPTARANPDRAATSRCASCDGRLPADADRRWAVLGRVVAVIRDWDGSGGRE